MRSRLAVLAAGLVAALGVPGVAAADDGGRPFSTALTGAAEVPGPGDPDATGQAAITLNQGRGEVCFDISWADIDGTVFAAHIHVGTATQAGPVVVTLFTGAFGGTDAASACVDGVDPALIKAIRQDPSRYYVNVHSTVFPGGAVRGQLAK
jgi:CHRD domain